MSSGMSIRSISRLRRMDLRQGQRSHTRCDTQKRVKRAVYRDDVLPRPRCSTMKYVGIVAALLRRRTTGQAKRRQTKCLEDLHRLISRGAGMTQVVHDTLIGATVRQRCAYTKVLHLHTFHMCEPGRSFTQERWMRRPLCLRMRLCSTPRAPPLAILPRKR